MLVARVVATSSLGHQERVKIRTGRAGSVVCVGCGTFPGSGVAVGASLPQPGDGGKYQSGAQGYDPLEVHQRLEVVVERFVREEHLNGDVNEERGAGVDEDGEPVEQGGEQRGPEDDQRYRRRQADHEQPEVDLAVDPGGADECYHV